MIPPVLNSTLLPLTAEQIPLSVSIVSPNMLSMFQGVEPPEFPEDHAHRERALVAVVELIVKLVKMADFSLKKQLLKDLDANPGDAGCQLRALKFHSLSGSLALKEELSQLNLEMTTLSEALKARPPVSFLNRPQESPAAFFQRKIAPLSTSSDLAYLLQCRLLFALKSPHIRQENGVIVTKTDCSKLPNLSKKILVFSTFLRNQFVGEVQSKVSAASIVFIQQEAQRLSSLPFEDKDLVCRMLAPEMIHQSIQEGYAPKFFSCGLFNLKTVLHRLREAEALIAIKKIAKKSEETFHLFLQPAKAGEEFRCLTDKECSELPGETPLVEFEAVVSLGREELALKVNQLGFTQIVLACAAQEDPYAPKSTLEMIPLQEARAEVIKHREIARAFGCVKTETPFILIDHMAANCLKHIIKPSRGGKT